ncbi:hypothetical protein C0431_09720 [bacterium]|nr:hypothetical protein [bacterium]
MGIFADPWFMLLLGLLLGWGIEWVIDLAYFRKRLRFVEGSERALEDRDRFQKQVADQSRVIEDLRSQLAERDLVREKEVERLRAEWDALRGVAEGEVYLEPGLESTFESVRGEQNVEPDVIEVIPVKPEPVEQELGEPLKVYVKAAKRDATLATGERDSLRAIRGIGPKYENMFWEAGVLTYKDLAELSEEALLGIINPEGWQKVDPAAWIGEADRLARNGR